jgi:hypothetical protein
MPVDHQLVGSCSGRDHAGLRGVSFGEHGPGGAEEQAQRLELPWPVEQQLRGAMGPGWACSTISSFSKSWYGEAFHKLGVQSAVLSALPCVLPQPIVSPASEQSPWFMELIWSAAVS